MIVQILKLDVTSGATKRWGVVDGSPSEPVFVPHPDAKSEDDGMWQLLYMYCRLKSSELQECIGSEHHK